MAVALLLLLVAALAGNGCLCLPAAPSGIDPMTRVSSRPSVSRRHHFLAAQRCLKSA